MRLHSRFLRQKGVALIFALFTAALLLSMSTTVVALAMRHGRDSGTVNYTEASVHAANWALEATLNYMGDGANWVYYDSVSYAGSDYYNNNIKSRYPSKTGVYNQSACLAEQPANQPKFFLRDKGVGVVVTKLSSDKLPLYGLDYTKATTIGESNWKYGDTVLLQFVDKAKKTYAITYDDQSFANVEVVVTDIRYPVTHQPNQYQILSNSKIYRFEASGLTTEAAKLKYILANRTVEARVREEMASDFMHFIQNARSWDAKGVDLIKNIPAQDVVRLPNGYEENGRLRVDGISNEEARTDPLKRAIQDKSGSLAFFSKLGNFARGLYDFAGDVVTQRNRDQFYYTNQYGSSTKPGNDVFNSYFAGSLTDGANPVGLPQADDYFNYARHMASLHDKYSSGERLNIRTASPNLGGTGFNSTDSRIKAYNAYAGSVSGSGAIDKSGGTYAWDYDVVNKNGVPTFAVTRIVLGGGSDNKNVSITKYNPANGKSVSIWSGSSDKINNGIISVTGGNVEILAYATNTTSTPKTFAGSLTIVADAEANRDFALNSTDTTSTVAGCGNAANRADQSQSIYSDVARLYQQSNPTVNKPPFTQAQLKTWVDSIRQPNGTYVMTKTDGSKINYSSYVDPTSVDKQTLNVTSAFTAFNNNLAPRASDRSKIALWPTPANSAVEREGNVFLSSDLICQSGNTASSLGVVAKNFVYLNDRQGDDELRVDAVLMSVDHSVQFDWDNSANNANWTRLTERKNNKNRKFTLNGAIVSSFLDVEGDTNNLGYYDQNFQHNENLRYNLPPLFPRWNRDASSSTFWNWVILSYTDNGALNEF